VHAVERIEQQAGRSDFDLTVFLWDEARGCNGTFDYNADLFERTTIDRMQRHLRSLLSAALAAPDQPVAQLPLLDPAERDQLLVAWSGAPVAATETRCFHELFRERAQAHPDDLAVAEAGPTARALSYAELDRRSNQLARYLQEHGAQPDTRIGLCTDRGLESIVGILGILKSGGAYVPLDPDYPRDRLAYMIEDAAPVLLADLDKQKYDKLLVVDTAPTPSIKIWDVTDGAKLSNGRIFSDLKMGDRTIGSDGIRSDIDGTRGRGVLWIYNATRAGSVSARSERQFDLVPVTPSRRNRPAEVYRVPPGTP